MVATGKVIVALPVKNEEAVIRICLERLRAQTQKPDVILLLLNNCTDLTLRICTAAQRDAPDIRIENYELSGVDASAGEARRLALGHAMGLADGLVLTTDADALPDHTWIADNVAQINAGADVVCGMAEIDPADLHQLTDRLISADRRERSLLKIIDQITSSIDPDPADPWPRHQQNSGASIAMKSGFLHRIGGAPRVPSGEDRALIEKLRHVDARIRHAPHIKVIVSGRLEGRAAGGMAETIRRRLIKADEFLDEAIEPVVDVYRRAKARAALREVRDGQCSATLFAQDLLIRQDTLHRALDSPFFGAAWAEIERESPVLRRRRVPTSHLSRETRSAQILLQRIKNTRAVQQPKPRSVFGGFAVGHAP